MKKKLIPFLGALLLAGAMASGVQGAPEAAAINLQVDGKPLAAQAYLDNSRTLIPLRAVGEALGAKVSWQAETKAIYCSLSDTTAVLKVGDNTMDVNGNSVSLDAAPVIIEGTTYVPVRAVADALGATVAWEATTKTVIINTKPTVDKTKAGAVDSLAYETDKVSSDIKAGSKVIMPVTATYPSFEGKGRAASRLNSIIAEDAAKRVRLFKGANEKPYYNLYQQAIKAGTRDAFDNYYYTLDYAVKTNSNGVVSLLVTEEVSGDKGVTQKAWGLTVSSSEGVIMTDADFCENAQAQVKAGLIEEGYSKTEVNKLQLDQNSFYIEGGDKMVYLINLPTVSQPISYSLKVQPKEEGPALKDVAYVTGALKDSIVGQDSSTVMELTAKYPVFDAIGKDYSSLNSAIVSSLKNAMADYKELNRANALSAYKAFKSENSGKRYAPWLWTVGYKVVYNNNSIASVVVDYYTYKDDEHQDTVYKAYVCDLETGEIIQAESLMTQPTLTEGKARQQFIRLIESNRLNFYTDVFERFDIKKAEKYITKDGVTYMFSPGELASVSKGVIEVTVPLE